jgi:hypothetical protein
VFPPESFFLHSPFFMDQKGLFLRAPPWEGTYTFRKSVSFNQVCVSFFREKKEPGRNSFASKKEAGTSRYCKKNTLPSLIQDIKGEKCYIIKSMKSHLTTVANRHTLKSSLPFDSSHSDTQRGLQMLPDFSHLPKKTSFLEKKRKSQGRLPFDSQRAAWKEKTFWL